MDENRLPELPQESFRPMIAQSVQLEQFLGEELIFCFRNLDGVHTFTTCYGDIYKTVNALRDYVRLLESVCDQWELTGFIVLPMSTMPKSFVKLRISCKLVSATTMTKPWKDAKRNEPKSPTAAMSGKMPFY